MKKNKRKLGTLLLCLLLIGGCSKAKPVDEIPSTLASTEAETVETITVKEEDETSTEVETSEDMNDNTEIIEEVEGSPEEDKNTFITNTTLNGRGRSDSSRNEPQYVGENGFVVISSLEERPLQQTEEFVNTPWQIPVYEIDNQDYILSGFIEHKTPITVLEQELTHKGYGSYSGYLHVKSFENDSTYYIDVRNFITKDYWNYTTDTIGSTGMYIAEFNQTSDYYPADRGNKSVHLDNGILVLVTGKTGLSGNGPSSTTHPISALVFQEWEYGYGGVTIHFNADDLVVVY